MALNIVKLAVGIRDIGHLKQKQKNHMNRDGILVHTTRNTPVRIKEILDGGSIYWVIKKFIRVRQRIIDFEKRVDLAGRGSCLFVLDKNLVKTELKEFRAFQGWRYFKKEEIPQDLNRIKNSSRETEELPQDLRLELQNLGLL